MSISRNSKSWELFAPQPSDLDRERYELGHPFSPIVRKDLVYNGQLSVNRTEHFSYGILLVLRACLWRKQDVYLLSGHSCLCFSFRAISTYPFTFITVEIFIYCLFIKHFFHQLNDMVLICKIVIMNNVIRIGRNIKKKITLRFRHYHFINLRWYFIIWKWLNQTLFWFLTFN